MEPFRKVGLALVRLFTSAGYHRLRRTPLLGPVMLRAFDLALRGKHSITTSVLSGPLAGMVLEFDPRVQADVLVGRYELGVQEVITRELNDGDIAFDVGSHFGYLALLMALRVGGGGQVVCFEPDPEMVEGLRGNVERNSSKLDATVAIVAAAVGATPGRQFFARGTQSSRGKLSAMGELEVEVTTLDQAVDRYGVPRLVKIDVEGRELDVLAGAKDLLAQAATAFVIETHDDILTTDCTGLLDEFGYGCQEMREAGRAETYLVAKPRR